MLYKSLNIVLSSLFLAASFFASTVSANPISKTDLWQSDTAGSEAGIYGSKVTATSGMIDGRPDDIFGGRNGVEGGNAIFKDRLSDGTLVPDGYVHWVEWSTSSQVNLLRFSLHAANEILARGAPGRSFSQFTLYTGDGAGSWSQFYDTPTASLWNPVGNNEFMDLEVDLITPIVAQYFRAEFVGIRPGVLTIGNSGPRIIELDGFSTFKDGSSSRTPQPTQSVPEPSSLALIGLGLLGLIRRRAIS